MNVLREGLRTYRLDPLRTQLLLSELKLRTGITGSVSKNNRYVHLTGGRLKGPAYLETRDLYEYVEMARSGKLNGTKSFRWK